MYTILTNTRLIYYIYTILKADHEQCYIIIKCPKINARFEFNRNTVFSLDYVIFY